MTSSLTIIGKNLFGELIRRLLGEQSRLLSPILPPSSRLPLVISRTKTIYTIMTKRWRELMWLPFRRNWQMRNLSPTRTIPITEGSPLSTKESGYSRYRIIYTKPLPMYCVIMQNTIKRGRRITL